MEKTPTRRPMDYQDDHGEGWVGLRKQSMIEKMKGHTHNDRYEVQLLTSHDSNSQSWYRNLNLQSFC